MADPLAGVAKGDSEVDLAAVGVDPDSVLADSAYGMVEVDSEVDFVALEAGIVADSAAVGVDTAVEFVAMEADIAVDSTVGEAGIAAATLEPGSVEAMVHIGIVAVQATDCMLDRPQALGLRVQVHLIQNDILEPRTLGLHSLG